VKSWRAARLVHHTGQTEKLKKNELKHIEKHDKKYAFSVEAVVIGESGEDKKDELTSAWTGESAEDWWDWRNEEQVDSKDNQSFNEETVATWNENLRTWTSREHNKDLMLIVVNSVQTCRAS